MFKKNYSKKTYDLDRVDENHNLHRIKNDLGWIYQDYNNINPLISIYWFDNELKNICFPWVLKLERQFKAYFIKLYKQSFQTNNADSFLDKTNFNKKKCDDKKVNKIIANIEEILKNKNTNNIDELVFALTFGEFVTTILNFNESMFYKFAHHFGLMPDVFNNILKYLNILRNAIAHNKSIIKIIDEKNNKRFSIKLNFFLFHISKIEADILSTNAAGIIYVIYRLINSPNSKKHKDFIRDIKKLLLKLKRNINNNEIFNLFMKKIFLNYQKEILECLI